MRSSTPTRSVGSRDPLRLPRHLRRRPVAGARPDLAGGRRARGRGARGLRWQPRAEAQTRAREPARRRLRGRHAPPPGPRVWPAGARAEPDSARASDAARGAVPTRARRAPHESPEALRRLGAAGDVSLWVQAIGPGEGAHAFELGPLVVRTSPVEHGSMPNFAVRADAGARGVVYSSDTEPCDAVVALARGADTLIHEATFPDRDRGRFGVHSTAGEAGAVAARAGVRRLILAHIEADYHDELPAMADEARRRFGGVVG